MCLVNTVTCYHRRVFFDPETNTVIIIGIWHELQRVALDGPRRRQQDKFEEELNKFSSSVSLYCEEINEGACSVVENFAIEQKRRYANIDMPTDVRMLHGIPFNYTDGCTGDDETTKKWNSLREQYMLNRIKLRLFPELTILVVCGQGHMEALAKGCKQLGCKVEEHNLLQATWYDQTAWQVTAF